MGGAAIASPDPADSLPPDVAYALLLDTRPSTWQQLERYALFADLQAETDEPLNPGRLAFLPPGLSYADAIAPWVGDTVALALLPLDRPQAVQFEAYLVMVAPVANPTEVSTLLSAVAALRTDTPTTERFGDVEIQYWQPQYLDDDGDTDETDDVSERDDLNPLRSPLAPWTAALGGIKALPESKPKPADNEGLNFPIEDEPIPDVPGMAIAVLPDYVVTAASPEAIRRWLAERPPAAATTLADDPRYQRTVGDARYDRALGALHANLSEIVKYSLADSGFETFLPPLELPPLLDDLTPVDIAQLASTQLDSVVDAYVYPQTEGLRLAARIHYDNSTVLRQSAPETDPEAVAVLNQVPAASYLMVSGQNIADRWQELVAGLDLLAESETAPGPVNVFFQAQAFIETFTGLDLDEEVFRWMDGGFTLFLFPTPYSPLTAILPELEVGVGFAVQTRDRPAAEAMFAQLDQRLGAGLLEVESLTLNDQPASIWRWPTGESIPALLGHGWANDNTVVVTLGGDALAPVLSLSERQTLPGSSIFRRATESLPSPNQGYVYSNISAASSLISSLARSFLPADVPVGDGAGTVLGSMQTLSATLAFEPEMMRVDALLMLIPAEN
jgi:hypothetical protein